MEVLCPFTPLVVDTVDDFLLSISVIEAVDDFRLSMFGTQSFDIRQAKTVITIFGFTSTISSGSAYTLAPIRLAIERAYFAFAKSSS